MAIMMTVEAITLGKSRQGLAVSKTTFEKYKKEYSELSELLKKGRRKIVEEIENALFKRARGFEYEETETLIKEVGGVKTTQIRKVRKYCPPDVGACALILKNKDKENWADNPLLIELKKEMLELEKKKYEDGQW